MFSNDYDEHGQNKCQNNNVNSISSAPSMAASAAGPGAKLAADYDDAELTNAMAKDSQPNKKRQRKAYTKRNKKIEGNTKNKKTTANNYSVRFAEDKEAYMMEIANNMQGDVEFEDADDSCWNLALNNIGHDSSIDKSIDLSRLTNKKKQYLQDAIVDKNGAYSFLEDPVEYKKARKRLQNRESAVRSRQRKKNYQETLEQQLDEQSRELDRVTLERDHLKRQNS